MKLRCSPAHRGRLILFLTILLMTAAGRALPDALPQQITKSDVSLLEADSEVVEGYPAGLLLIPHQPPNYRDEKYKEPYHVACHVYIATPPPPGSTEPVFKRRFLVCAAGSEALPFVKKVAHTLLLLCSERRERLHVDHPTNQPTVNVWVTDRIEKGLSPDTGGEQFQNQIYFYDWHRDRQPIEWMREIAHEYGHYALPGISGFKSPEEWANGVLGERMFLKWTREDLRAGRLHPDDLAFVTPEMLDNYYTKEIWPLVRRILRDGVDVKQMTRQDAEGMNYYTGLALYVDALYGTPELVSAMADTRSASSLTFAHASDFLSGVQKALREETDFTLNLPSLGDAEKENTIQIYLPAGTWNVTMQGGALSWRIPPDTGKMTSQIASGVISKKAGWYRLSYLRTPAADSSARLLFQKRG